MPKFKKGHKNGFQSNNVPHNKGKKLSEVEEVPSVYKRLSPEMTDMVQNPPSASERVEMVLRPGAQHLLRPRKGVTPGDVETQPDQTCEQ